MKNRRYVLAGLLVALSIFLFEYYYLIPQSDLLKENLDKEHNALVKEEAYAQGSGMTEKGVTDAIEDMKNVEKKLIPEKTEFLASARLQTVVTGFADKSGVSLQTIRPMNKVKQGSYSSIPVYFEGNGNIRQISDFLKSVESGSILLKIDKLNLNVTSVQSPLDLKLKIQISGLARL